jgi:methylenetetrahydrofolate reductase (NADPH)
LNTLRDAIRQKDLVVTADLPLQPTTTAEEIEAMVAELAPAVDAVQVIDDREAAGHMSSIAAAAIVLRHGVDPVVHLTARDRNRIALQAELLGAAALGVTSLVISRGEKLSRKEFLRGKGVFDTNETRFIGMARRISEETALISPPGFMVGTYVTVFDPAESWEAARIVESLDAGVNVLYTQPCLNTRLLGTYMAKLVEKKILHRASVIVEVPLLDSHESARDYKKHNPIALIPEETTKRIMDAEDAAAEGFSACVEVLRELRGIPGISGVNIRHAGNATAVAAAIATAGL